MKNPDLSSSRYGSGGSISSSSSIMEVRCSEKNGNPGAGGELVMALRRPESPPMS